MKILIATDGSKFSEYAVRRACEVFGAVDGVELRVISAAEYATPIVSEQLVVTNDLFSSIAAEAKQGATEAAERAKEIVGSCLGKDRAANVETAVVSATPREAIVEEAVSWNADVIVVGSHGYGFWDRMLLGSVSDAVIHHAPCSVLVVRHVV